jgi:hypothetical protein
LDRSSNLGCPHGVLRVSTLTRNLTFIRQENKNESPRIYDPIGRNIG